MILLTAQSKEGGTGVLGQSVANGIRRTERVVSGTLREKADVVRE